MGNWFALNAPPATPPDAAQPGAAGPGGGNWFAQNAPAAVSHAASAPPPPDGLLARAVRGADSLLSRIPVAGPALGALGEVGEGALKGLGSTVGAIDNTAIGQKLNSAVLGANEAARENDAYQRLITPATPGQAFGKAAEQLGEYFVPVADELKLGQGSGLLAKALGDSRAARAAAHVGTAAADESAKSALVAAAQHGDVAGAAEFGAAAPVAVEGGLAALKAARPLNRVMEAGASARQLMDALGPRQIATPNEVARTAIAEGIPLTAPEVIGRGANASNQAAARNVYRLGQSLEEHGQKALDAWRAATSRWLDQLAAPDATDRFLGRYGEPSSASDAGKALRESAQRANDYANQDIEARYDALHKVAGDRAVNISPLADLGKQMLQETERLRALLPTADPKTATKLTGDLAAMEDAAGRLASGKVNFDDALQLRSALWKIGNVPSDIISDKAQQVAKRALEPLTDEMARSAAEAGPNAEGLWRSANSAWAKYANSFGKRGEILHTLLSADSDSDLEKLPARVMDGSVAKLLQLRDAGVDIAPAKRFWLDAATGGGDRPDLTQLSDALSKARSSWLRQVFPDAAEFEALQDLRRRGLVESIVSPGGWENAPAVEARLQRVIERGELQDLLGSEGATKARAMATIGARIAKEYNPSQSANVLGAMEQAAGGVRKTMARTGFLRGILDPESAERITGLPVLGTGPAPDGRLSAAVKKALRWGAGSAAGAAGANQPQAIDLGVIRG